jgi:NosR/NirI family transcriptional regulator, nitrous oxide reductase regulator
LMPRKWRYTGRLPKAFQRTLEWIRPVLLVWILLVALLQLSFSLVDLEPFDAYAWRAAAWPTLAVALVGLAISIRIPMAYCRFGCPTGALLSYLRRSSSSNRLSRADLFVGCCVGMSVLLMMIG